MAGKISLRKIWAVARTEWLKWVCNPRMIIIPVLTVFIYSYAITPLLERSEKMGEPLNLLEPLIAVGNSGMLTLIIPLVFLTLMSDFPKTDGWKEHQPCQWRVLARGKDPGVDRTFAGYAWTA